MKRRFKIIILWGLLVAIAACKPSGNSLGSISPLQVPTPTPASVFQSPSSPPLQPPSSLATPTLLPTSVIPTATPQSTATTTVTPEPSLTPTPSPSPLPTATYPPYTGTPFTITFIRDGDLWLSEIGGTGERQLTHESADWPVVEYATAPSCDRIAYIPYKGPPAANALIKQVLLPSSSVSVLTGEGDAFIEYGVGWLDNRHITFVLSEFTVDRIKTDWNGFEPFHHLVLDLTTGKRTFVPESLHFSQSPNGRYWLTGSCYYVYECPLEYVLHDLVTGTQWRVAESIVLRAEIFDSDQACCV